MGMPEPGAQNRGFMRLCLYTDAIGKLELMRLGLRSLISGNKAPLNSGPKPRSPHSQKKVGKWLDKREQSYQNAHNQLADSIEIRNKAQSKLTVDGINQGTQSEALEQVSMSQAKNFIGDNHLASGFVDGFSVGKAEIKGITPAQYAQPGPKTNMVAGSQVLGMAPDVMRGGHAQYQVTQRAVKFQGAQRKLYDARLAESTAQQGGLRKQKKGKIISGSYQASSPEALAAMLQKAQPASNIGSKDIGFYIPNEAGLLPKGSPAHLPASTTRTISQPAPKKTVDPKMETEKLLAQRDQKIGQLDQSLRKQDSEALEKAIQNRDYYQLQTSSDLVKGLAQTPRDSAILGINYLYRHVPKGPGATPLFSAQTIQQAENKVGYAVGKQMAGSETAKPMLRQQVEVEKLHRQGKPIATELRDLHKQKAMEADRRMIVDRDGDKFYNAFESPFDIKQADRRYDAMAREKLPRSTDQLYLNDDLTRFVPNRPGEMIRRPLNGWFNPPAL